jgi:hypothetical protein
MTQIAQNESADDADCAAEQPLGWRGHLGLLLAYMLLAIWLTWPLAAQIGTHYVSSGNDVFFFPATPDAPQNIWNMWWLRRALADGVNPFVSPLLYYPDGVSMYLQTFNSVAGVLALPANWLLGPIAAYNVAALTGVMLTGYAGFWLVRAFSGGVAAPFVAGALLTASPFHMAKLDAGQLNFVTMQWLIFAMLAFVVLTRRSDWWTPPLAALAFTLVLLTDWYWALVAALFALVWGVASLIGRPRPAALFARLTIAAALCALFALPLLLPLATSASPAAAPAERSAIWAVYTQGYSADLFGLVFPAALHPLWAAPAERFLVAVAPFGITEGSYTAAGWVLVALALIGMQHATCNMQHGKDRPQYAPRTTQSADHWRLLAVGAVGWLLALGPALYVFGVPTGIPLPYAALQSLPLLDTARRPNLFGVITIAVAAIFAGVALRELLARRERRGRMIVLALVGGLALFELWPAARVSIAPERAPVFAQIAERPGVVVDLPVEGGTDSRPLINQMVHGQPILRGYVARPPQYATLRYAPLVNMLGRTQAWPAEDIVDLSPAALATMQCYYRLRHVVLDTTLLDEPAQQTVLANLERLPGGAPAPWYDDGRHRAYELALPDAPCAPFAYLGGGWNNLEQADELRWRWTTAASQVFVVNPAPAPASVGLALTVEAREAGQVLAIRQGDSTVATLALERGRRTYRLPLLLDPGTTALELRTAAMDDPAAQRQLGVSVQAIRLTEPRFAL